MGDIVVLTATYVVGKQSIDVKDYVTLQQSKNYGAIDFPVQKMDDELRAQHRITVKEDDSTLQLSPPHLTIEYTDRSQAYHSVDYSVADKVDIGQRSALGKFVQKPGDVLWDTAATIAKGQFLFVFVLGWALVVLWAFQQWAYLQAAFNSGALPGTLDDSFGILGKYVAVFAFTLFKLGSLLGKPFQMLLGGADVRPGWIVKFLFSAFAVFTPVSSFFFQFLIWFTLVQTLLDKNQ